MDEKKAASDVDSASSADTDWGARLREFRDAYVLRRLQAERDRYESLLVGWNPGLTNTPRADRTHHRICQQFTADMSAWMEQFDAATERAEKAEAERDALVQQLREAQTASNRVESQPYERRSCLIMIDLSTLNMQERPRGDRIVVLPLLAATSSRFVLTDENREKPERGIVIAIGPGGIGAETGRPIPILSTVGELVSHGKYAGQDFEIQGPDGPLRAIIMRDSEVLLSQDAGTYELEVHDGDPRKIHVKGLTCEHCPKADLSEERARLLEERGTAVRTSDPEDLIDEERRRLETASAPQ